MQRSVATASVKLMSRTRISSVLAGYSHSSEQYIECILQCACLSTFGSKHSSRYTYAERVIRGFKIDFNRQTIPMRACVRVCMCACARVRVCVLWRSRKAGGLVKSRLVHSVYPQSAQRSWQVSVIQKGWTVTQMLT